MPSKNITLPTHKLTLPQQFITQYIYKNGYIDYRYTQNIHTEFNIAIGAYTHNVWARNND